MSVTNRKNKRCFACYREAIARSKKYCVYHSQAYNSLHEQYGAWVNAYGDILWKEYMKKLLTLNQTGSWVKDVINIELRETKNNSRNHNKNQKKLKKILASFLFL